MTTTPTASPGPLDLARLEALARAADEGEGQHIYTNPRDSDGWQAKEAWHHAASPAAVLALIALARRAQPYATGGMVPGGLHLAGEGLRPLCGQPESEATQAAPLSEVQIDRIARAYFSEQWAVQHAKDVIHDAFEDARKSATLSPLCGAQHAESGKEAADKGIHGLLETLLRPYGIFDVAIVNAHAENQRDFFALKDRARAALAAQQAAAPGAMQTAKNALQLLALNLVPHNPREVAKGALGAIELAERTANSAPGTPEAPSPPFPISDDEIAALRRFQETCEDSDSGGYDVEKDMMKRLAAIGVIESKGFGRYQFTKFGDFVVGRAAQLDGGQEGSGSNG